MGKRFIGGFEVTKHAQIRMQQRGVRDGMTDIILTFADRRVNVGGESQAFSVSRKNAQKLIETGVMAPSMADRIKNKAVVVANDNHVVTVMNLEDGKRGRRYRKGRK